MDDPALDSAVYHAILNDLARVNRLTLAARPTLSFLNRAVGDVRYLRLLDVGFGQGDMLRRIAHWTRRRRISAELVGVDLNPNSERVARAATSPDAAIDYRTGDYRDVPGRFDFVISSLVAHHMTNGELCEFVRFMESRCSRGWIVNDLHRHRVAHFAYPILARMIAAHRVVREGGTLSIARSFRPAEWRQILREAGVPDGAAQTVRQFPYRLCVERLF